MAEVLDLTDVMDAALDAEDFEIFEAALERRGSLVESLERFGAGGGESGGEPGGEDRSAGGAEKHRGAHASSVGAGDRAEKVREAEEEEMMRILARKNELCMAKLAQFQEKTAAELEAVRKERLGMQKATDAQSKYQGFWDSGASFDRKK